MGPVPGVYPNNRQRTEPASLTDYHAAGACKRRAVKHQLLQVVCRDCWVYPSLLSKPSPFHRPAVEDRE